MEVNIALDKLRNVINEEKKQLDAMLRGAELLASMLSTEKQSGNKEGQQVEYSQPSVAPGQGGSETAPLYSTP